MVELDERCMKAIRYANMKMGVAGAYLVQGGAYIGDLERQRRLKAGEEIFRLPELKAAGDVLSEAREVLQKRCPRSVWEPRTAEEMMF